jgi:peptidoglycan/LPS O-acetylase OafA/YrhL
VRLADIDYRNNSIGFLRLLFATLVIFSHGFGLGGFNGGSEPIVALSHNVWSFGGFAVCGFFFLSGFLVTRSYEGLRSLPRFLWHRVVRIFPGYWCCLLVSVFLFAPALYFVAHGTLSGYWSAPPPGNPLGYLAANYSLDVYQIQIADIFAKNPFPIAFNGSIWTLGNEFRAYLTVAVLGVLGLLTSRRAVVLAVLVILWAGSVFEPFTTGLLAQHRLIFGLFEGSYAFEEMFVYFFAGSAAYLYREYIPIRWPFFALAAAATFAILPLPWFRVLMPLTLGYATIWLMCRLPIRSIDRRADFSYGIYIYAFPVQQTLWMFQANRLGLPAYMVLSLLGTVPLAAASWFLVEAPAMRLKNTRLPFITAAERALAQVDAFASKRRSAAAPFFERLAELRAPLARPRNALSAAVAVALLAIFAVSAYRSQGTDATPSTSSGIAAPAGPPAFLPLGIADAETGSATAPRGIFSSATQSECCWMGRTATFRVVAPSSAGRLVLHAYIPNYPYLQTHRQRIHPRVDGQDASPTAWLSPGLQDIDVSLRPGRDRPTLHEVTLAMDQTFEPSNIGVGNDTRELSLVLLSVSSR